MEWQLIEKAPKDGTEMWLWWPDADERYPVVGRWKQVSEKLGGFWLIVKRGAGIVGSAPTHWMPLPEKPII